MENRFDTKIQSKYSVTFDGKKSVNFLSLIEIYTFIQFQDAGISTKKILKAHEILSNSFNLDYPFASKQIIDFVKSDGKEIYFEENNHIIYRIDGNNQLNLEFIKLFFKKIDFDHNLLARKLWPIGKDKNVICDPEIKFGAPTISGTGILVETINKMIKAGESKELILSLFNLSMEQIDDAISFYK